MEEKIKLAWAKFKKVCQPTFVGRDTVALASGNLIIFTNTKTGEVFNYRAAGDEFGDGVSCVSGHRSLPILAFAELCIKPRIFILSFPELKTLQVLRSQHSGAYLEVRFSETEYLVSLSGVPNCQLEIWNWRSGKLLVVQDTGINSHYQNIKCNRSNPLMIAQYAPDLAKLNVWETYVSLEQAFLIKRPINIPFIKRDSRISLTFGIEGNIYLVDKIGNLFSLYPSSGVTKEIWHWKGEIGNFKTSICFYRGGFVIAGSNHYLSFVKKVNGIWSEIWSIKNFKGNSYLRVLNYETLFGISEHSAIKCLKDTEDGQEFEQIGTPDMCVKFFDLLQPACEFITAITLSDEITILDISNGDLITSISLPNIICIRSHPLYPIIAIGDENGVVFLLSFYYLTKPIFISKFHLCDSVIESLKFNQAGDTLFVKDRLGDFFIIRGKIGVKLEVVAHLPYLKYIFDFCILETEDNLNIIILSTTDKDEVVSKTVDRVIISKADYQIEIKSLNLPHNFTSIETLNNNLSQIVATQFLENHAYIFELKTDGSLIEIEILRTLHQLKYIRVNCDSYNIITWGMDGLVCIFDVETRTLRDAYVAHSRRRQGIKYARCTPNYKYIVTLGHTGNLQAFLLPTELRKISSKVTELQESLQTQFMGELLTNETPGFEPKEDSEATTWLKFKQKRQVDLETIRFASKRIKIQVNFEVLQSKLKALLDNNEQLKDENQIPMQSFNLNHEWATKIVEMAKKERNLEDSAIKLYVADQTRMTNWIVDNTWDQMIEKCCKIRGIFSEISCENFGLWQHDSEIEKNIAIIKLRRLTQNLVAKKDTFLPWDPRKPNEIQRFLEKEPRCTAEGSHYFSPSASFSGSEGFFLNESAILQQRIAKYALSGTSSFVFIEPTSLRYDQLDVVSYDQMYAEEIMGQYDMLNLRKYFNEEFNDLRRIKEEEMAQVKSRNDRLRHIQSELKILAQLKNVPFKIKKAIIDPVYRFDEKPDTIIKVEDSEVQMNPYISPSRKIRMQEEARLIEERRRDLLSDDFKERALMAMIDGVLEKRWEDEIKKQPPVPECIETDKNPAEYTKEDLRSIKEYEENMEVLRTEREKYRNILHEELVRLQKCQDEQILKFNQKCAELCMLKFRVEAAIRQEELKLLRNALYNYQRTLYKRGDRELVHELTVKKNSIEELSAIVEELEKRVQECRYRYEQLQSKDRSLDKQFKSQFGESAPQVIVDQAYKIFKKRPKWQQRAWATSAILSDLAARIANKNNSRLGPPLPEECYEFLNLIENTENYSNAPSNIDQNLWNLLCRMRRIKMESEFKVKACGAQLAEAEATLNAYIRELSSKKSSQNIIERQREDLRQKYYKHLLNRYVQLVMKRGIVEITLSGHMSDFDGCILLNALDVGDINAIIKRAGEKKLKTMEKSAIFRRKIINKEYQHKELRNVVQDLTDFLHVIEKCKVTKEIQMWLKRKELGRPDDMSQKALNREIDQSHKYLQSKLSEIMKQVEQAKQKLRARKRENRMLDMKIQAINIDVTEQSIQRDYTMEEKELRQQKERMAMIIERGKLVRKVQDQHAHILELATLLELQRLRTFPTLNVTQRNIFS